MNFRLNTDPKNHIWGIRWSNLVVRLCSKLLCTQIYHNWRYVCWWSERNYSKILKGQKWLVHAVLIDLQCYCYYWCTQCCQTLKANITWIIFRYTFLFNQRLSMNSSSKARFAVCLWTLNIMQYIPLILMCFQKMYLHV